MVKPWISMVLQLSTWSTRLMSSFSSCQPDELHPLMWVYSSHDIGRPCDSRAKRKTRRYQPTAEELLFCLLLEMCWRRFSKGVLKIYWYRISPGSNVGLRRSHRPSTQRSWYPKCRMKQRTSVSPLSSLLWMLLKPLMWFGRGHC